MDLVASVTPTRVDLDRLAADLERVAEAAVADNTRTGYASDFRRFAGWCMQHGVESMPAAPGTVAAYLLDAANDVSLSGKRRYATATLTRWLAAINQMHVSRGQPKPGDDPRLKMVMRAVRRERGSAQRRVEPLLLGDVTAIVETMSGETWPYVVSCIRDTALILVGFAGAFRRSELAGLVRENVTYHRADGVHLRLESSKTDQEGEGMVKALPYGKNALTCAPCAIWRWTAVLDVANSGGGRAAVMRAVKTLPDWDTHTCRRERPDATGDRSALFRPITQAGRIGRAGLSGRAIAEIVKKRATEVGLDPDKFSGHSMRAGFVTQAFRAGADSNSIRRQTGHKSDTMLSIYQREHAPLIGNAVTKIGL